MKKIIKIKKIIIIILLLFSSTSYCAAILPGAEQTALYFPLLKNKRVAIFANHTSLIGQEHLIDVLRHHGFNIVKIFVPEHGFRGNADAGEKINNTVDTESHIPLISLYGKKVKPTADDLRDVDLIVFDIQDVGVRFYTYISSLQRVMEAAVENHKPIIVLDRPNPNGFYIDGPVLDPKYKSFTGMQPIPIIYGMTMGEYAQMLVGEQWLEVRPKSLAKNLKLTVIPCKNYTHQSLYKLPVKPSPNLPTMQSIYLYPSIALMESTVMSVGRGTSTPFQVYGHPLLKEKFHFIPRPKVGEKHPLYENQICYGWNLIGNKNNILRRINRQLQIKYLIHAYQAYPDKSHFFKGFSYAWGNDNFISQMQSGISEENIRKSWEPALSQFKKIRKKYLIYPES